MQNQQEYWDESELLDPYQHSFEQGKQDGRIAGLRSGYTEGAQLGHHKALELGIEIGYMHGFAKEMLEQIHADMKEQSSISSRQNEMSNSSSSSGSSSKVGEEENELSTNTTSINLLKKEKRILELIEAIESFPTPEMIFENNRRKNMNHTNEDEDTETHDENNPSSLSSSSSSSKSKDNFDITNSLQRIRAKFQTLMVQMKKSHLTLKKVMERAGLDDKKATISANDMHALIKPRNNDSNDKKRQDLLQTNEW